MGIKKVDILWRVGLVYLAVAVFAIALIIKIFYLQVIDDDKWKEIASRTRVMDVKIPPARGDIYSDDMRLLASSVPFYEVRIDLWTDNLTDSLFQANVDRFAGDLSRLFGDRSKSEYKERLMEARQNHNRYMLIKNKISFV